jgi:hypothetical protein
MAAEKNASFGAMDAETVDNGYYYDEAPEMENGAAADSNVGDAGQSSAYKNAKVKLIRRATVRLETKEFDAAVRGLESLVNELDGYIESSSLNQGGYGSTYRSASYTVRVPSGKYSDFLTRVSSEEHCHLTSKDESTEDVGQQYFDTETRLKTLRTKLERLQELLAQAKHMDDIITLEDAISSTEYEIDNYSSTLNRYDSLIGYSTFNVTIEQVVTISDTDTISFGQRLGNSFMGGLENFIDAIQEFLVWLVGNVFGIALLIVLILVIRFLLRKRKEKRDKKLREMGIDPNATRTSGWKRQHMRRVPPGPIAPPPTGKQPENTAAQQPSAPPAEEGAVETEEQKEP